MSDFDKGDLTWLKSVADGAMDNLLSVGRAERTLLHIAELEARVARLKAKACDEIEAHINRRLAAEAKLRAVGELPNLVPTSWLDPILSGTASKFKGRGPYHGADIEYLLLEVKKRIKTELEALLKEVRDE